MNLDVTAPQKPIAQCVRRDWGRGGGGGATGTYYGGPAFRNGARVPAMLHTFLSFSVVSLFVDCTNLTLSDRAQVT